jgi:TnpA family transposase
MGGQFIGGTINLKQLLAQWLEILRLTCSIRLGTVTSSLILRKLASYPRQTGLALALREFGRIERARSLYSTGCSTRICVSE